MELSTEQIKNLLKMFNSFDESNHTVAFELINTLNYEKCLGELLVLYKFSNVEYSIWEKNSPNVINFLESKIEDNNFSKGNCFKILLNHNCSKVSQKLYLELINDSVFKLLNSIDYPMDKLHLMLTIKNYG